MNHSYLYLFKDAADPYLKIGKANDWANRLSQLPDTINLSQSYIVACSDEKIVYQLEKSLHLLFDSHRLEREHRGTGYTEWFDSSILSDVLHFLETSQKFWQYTIHPAPVLPTPLRPTVKTSPPPRTPTATTFYQDRTRMIQDTVAMLQNLSSYHGTWDGSIFRCSIPEALVDTINRQFKNLVLEEHTAHCISHEVMLTGFSQCPDQDGVECELFFNEEYISALYESWLEKNNAFIHIST